MFESLSSDDCVYLAGITRSSMSHGIGGFFPRGRTKHLSPDFSIQMRYGFPSELAESAANNLAAAILDTAVDCYTVC